MYKLIRKLLGLCIHDYTVVGGKSVSEFCGEARVGVKFVQLERCTKCNHLKTQIKQLL